MSVGNPKRVMAVPMAALSLVATAGLAHGEAGMATAAVCQPKGALPMVREAGFTVPRKARVTLATRRTAGIGVFSTWAVARAPGDYRIRATITPRNGRAQKASFVLRVADMDRGGGGDCSY